MLSGYPRFGISQSPFTFTLLINIILFFLGAYAEYITIPASTAIRVPAHGIFDLFVFILISLFIYIHLWIIRIILYCKD